MKFDKKTKQELRKANSGDRISLFNTAWGFIVDNFSPSDVFDFPGLDQLYYNMVSGLVNDQDSEFYIYG